MMVWLARVRKLAASPLFVVFLLVGCGGLEESPLIDGTGNPAPENPDDGQSDDPINQAPGAAAVLYGEQCAGCHGDNGEGGSGGGLHSCTTCDDRDALYREILDTMPLAQPAQCDAQCSEMLTNYILSGFQDDSGEDPGIPDDDRPTADLSESRNLVGTIPLTVSFNALASTDPNGQIVRYQWSFGDGSTAEGLQTTHIYETAGNYVVSLTVTDSEGLSDVTSTVVQAFSPLEDLPPVARFSSSATSGTAPFTVTFNANDSSDDVGIVSYQWDFGGRDTATGSTVEYTFTEVSDALPVTLTVFDANNSSDSTTQNILVVAPDGNQPPVANASRSTNVQGDAPLSVVFDGTASSDDGGALSYFWSFGDGNFAEGSQVNYQYSGVGQYTAILTVYDGQLSDSASVIVDVTQPANNAAPQANANVSTTFGIAPLAVQFNASGSTDDGAISSYEWDFGDGSTSTDAVTSHSYAQAGTYNGSLVVVDAQGLSDTETFTIVVQDESEIAASIYDSQCASCHGDDGEGTAAGPGLEVNRDLATQTQIVAAMPPGSGINCGAVNDCATIVARYILDRFARDNQAPTANLSNTSNTSGSAPLSVQFDASASTDDFGIVSYQWDFGDQSDGVGETITHIYTSPGTYFARVIVTDEEGETGTTSIRITVSQSQGNQAPVAAIDVVSAQAGVAPYTLSVSGEGSVDDVAIASYSWDFDGDGESDSQQATGDYQFFVPGDYDVSLTVTDAAGLSSTETITVVVYDNDDFGEERYASQCAVCHGGSGQGGVGPRLTSDWDVDYVTTEVARMIDEQNSNCLGVDDAQCTDSITDFLMANIVGNGGDGDAPFACEIPEPATGIDVKRLSQIEYRNTMHDIVASRLGENTAVGIVDDAENGVERLVPDDHHESGFRKMDSKVALEYVEGWFLFSLELVDAIMPNITTFVGDSCASNPTDTDCMRDFIEAAGREFMRKPLTEAQVDLYATSTDYRELLVRMFNAPDFIYHMEIDGDDVVDRDDLRELTPHEIAARLSYTYWQSMPDAQLRAYTDNGTITTDYDAVLDYVMNSSKAREGVKSYFEDWWETEETPIPSEVLTRGLRLVDQDPGDADTSLPLEFDSLTYRHEAIEEVLDLAEFVTWEQEGTLSDLFTSNRSFARSENLAKAYGVETWNGDYNSVVTFPAGQRSGLLTRAAFHIYGGDRSNPILKGARVRKRLLCDSIPLPADNTPPDVQPDPNWTTRELVVAQTESTGGCSACHLTSINPPGFATEDFDVLGRFRTTQVDAVVGLFDPNGGEVEGNVFADIEREIAISAQVQPYVDGESDETETNSGVEFSEVMAASAKPAQCLARTFFRHTFSREEQDNGDGCVLNSIEQAARSGSMRSALRTVAEQPEFKLRKIAE